MRKILILTYYWPPASGPGVQRTLKFCKHLPNEGIDPIVLTVEDGAFQSVDESLLEDIPKDLMVVKTQSFDLYKWMGRIMGKKNAKPSIGMIGLQSNSPMARIKKYVRANAIIPDMRKGWNKYALEAAKKILEEEKIDLIYSTGPPHSTHLIALELQKKFPVKWIADFRDPWVNIFYNKILPRTASTVRKDQALEDSVVKAADQLIVVSKGLREEFVQRNKSTQVIYNGYDEDDFGDREKSLKTELFTIAYIGNFKPNQNVKALWQALEKLKDIHPKFLQHLQLKIVGNVDPSILRDIEYHGLDDALLITGFQPHQVAVEAMMQSNVLLFIIPHVEDNHLILTGKLFEYLAAGSEMLSIGPTSGNASAIINECGRLPMKEYHDTVAMKDQIEKLYLAWVNNNGLSLKLPLNDAIKKYSRKGQTKKLADIIHAL